MNCFYLNTFYSIAMLLYFCTSTSFDSHYHQHHCHCFDYYCCYYYVVVFFITVIAIIISFFFNAFNFYCSTFYDSILYLPINRTFLNLNIWHAEHCSKLAKKTPRLYQRLWTLNIEYGNCEHCLLIYSSNDLLLKWEYYILPFYSVGIF